MRGRSLIAALLASLVVLGAACSSGGHGAGTTVTGVLGLITAPPSGFTYPEVPGVQVMGRSADEFKVEAKGDDPLGIGFKIKGLPREEPLVFLVTSPQLDSTLSLPYMVGSGKPLFIGVLPAGMISQVQALASAAGGVLNPKGTTSGTIDYTSQGMVIGALAPLGGGCAGYTSIDLRSEATQTTVLNATKGPFYFTEGGDVVEAGVFADTYCSFVLFNLVPGAYLLAAVGPTVKQAEVIVLAAKTVASYGIPGE